MGPSVARPQDIPEVARRETPSAQGSVRLAASPTSLSESWRAGTATATPPWSMRQSPSPEVKNASRPSTAMGLPQCAPIGTRWASSGRIFIPSRTGGVARDMPGKRPPSRTELPPRPSTSLGLSSPAGAAAASNEEDALQPEVALGLQGVAPPSVAVHAARQMALVEAPTELPECRSNKARSNRQRPEYVGGQTKKQK